MSAVSDTEQRLKKGGQPGWKWSHIVFLAGYFLILYLIYWLLSTKNFLVPNLIYWLVAFLASLTILLMVLGILKKNISYVWWEVLLLVFGFSGVWILALAVLPFWAAVMVAGGMVLLPYIWPLTLWHDLTFVLGSMGIGLFLAIRFPFSVLLVCSLGVIAYEYSRQKQTQMATLLSEAFRTGLPPGILLPIKPIGWLKVIEETWQAGSGMVISLLPLIMLSAIGMRLAHVGWYWYLPMVATVLAAEVIWGHDKQNRLRSWIFLAVAVGFYALMGIINL
ncbi:MAG: hypothetical protein PHC53_02200 [Patescibacteria group bacterium]|nr:hypothetical protein [Patescibacteria group bacterium]